MKKLLTLTAIAAALVLTGCSSATDAPTTDSTTSEAPAADAPAPEPADLTGDWKQTNGEATTYQQATITADTISIDWVNEDQDSTSVYWVGTYTAPTEPGDTWAWTSDRNAEATDMALLASTDDTKDFTYENGVLSYSVSALGTTKTVELEKQ